ncbi:MAG: PLD nuclease N-terminal domain-containing protein [bacterium]|nr:PLD nuclease N-terminal domain-containing protein [bacterium]
MLALLAQATDDFTNTTIDTTNSAAATGVIAGLGILWLVFMLIWLVTTVFSIWMFIDALIRKDEDFATGSKVMWALLIFFFNFIPAIIYFFMVKKKSGQNGGTSTPTQSTGGTDAPA